MAFNPTKSEIFFAAVSDETKAQIWSCLQFEEGSLLVRFLDMPLISCKLISRTASLLLIKLLAELILGLLKTYLLLEDFSCSSLFSIVSKCV